MDSTVLQCDRDRVADLLETLRKDYGDAVFTVSDRAGDRVRQGNCDDRKLVQAFAAHRIANQPSSEEVRLRKALGDIFAHFKDCEQAPGHAHSVSGIWDDDSAYLAGTPCDWCAQWERARALLGSNDHG